MAMVTRRRVLQAAAVAAGGLTLPLVRTAGVAGLAPTVVPKGKMTLAWHSNIASRWLDPQQHDGTATPDNFLFANQDALIKNFRDKKYEHLALAEKFDFAEDGKSATFQLRAGLKFHDLSPVTPEDVRWSYEHYTGAAATVLHENTHAIDIVNDRTVKFSFKEPFLDFPILMGTGNVCGAGWIVPAKYYQKVGKDGFVQKPIGAGPYKLVSQQPGSKIEYEAFEDYYRPVHIKNFTIVSVPEAATRVAMLERGEADIIYLVPGELIDRIKNNPKLVLAPVISGSWWLEFPGFNDPKNPFHDKRVRQAVSRSEEHTSELQSRGHLVCRLLLEKKKHQRQPPREPDLGIETQGSQPQMYLLDWSIVANLVWSAAPLHMSSVVLLYLCVQGVFCRW